MTGARLSAHDFARLLAARQELEDQAGPYLNDLGAELRAGMEARGYREVSVRQTASTSAEPEVAAGAVVVLLARLPGGGQRAPVFRVQLPLAVTYARELALRGAQINRFTVTRAFVQPLSPERAEVAERIIDFLSGQYMEHLLGAGAGPAGEPSP